MLAFRTLAFAEISLNFSESDAAGSKDTVPGLSGSTVVYSMSLETDMSVKAVIESFV